MSPVTLPPIGFGTFGPDGEADSENVTTALEAGYRLLDTARMYGNEAAIGDGMARSSVSRNDIVVTTKIGHFTEPTLTADYVRTGVRESVDALGVETIDILFIHWPTESFEAERVFPVLDELVDDGLVRTLGVSNFTIPLLEEALDVAATPIVANQIECHPFLPQRAMREYASDHDVTVVGYSPLAQGQVFDSPILEHIAAAHDVSVPQVALAWAIDNGVVPIPKASSGSHIRENYRALEVELRAADLEAIDAIETRTRHVDPDWMDWDA